MCGGLHASVGGWRVVDALRGFAGAGPGARAGGTFSFEPGRPGDSPARGGGQAVFRGGSPWGGGGGGGKRLRGGGGGGGGADALHPRGAGGGGLGAADGVAGASGEDVRCRAHTH